MPALKDVLPRGLLSARPAAGTAGRRYLATDGGEYYDDGSAWQAVGPIRGRVTAAGGVGAGSGFTVNRTATGKFDVTYTTAFASEPIVLLTVWDDGAITSMTITLHASSATGFTAWVFSGGGAAFANFAFSFLAMAA